MEDADSCTCASEDVVIFTCAGGSNVGQIANQAGVRLAQDQRGRLVCLAGIGAHLSQMIEATRGRTIVAIDGCPVQCTTKTLEHADLKADILVIVTDLGIMKTHNLNSEPEDCEMVAEKIKETMGR